MEENMQLVQKRKKVHPSTKRLMWWLWIMVGILIILILWYVWGSVSINAQTNKPASTVETSIK